MKIDSSMIYSKSDKNPTIYGYNRPFRNTGSHMIREDFYVRYPYQIQIVHILYTNLEKTIEKSQSANNLKRIKSPCAEYILHNYWRM